MPEPALPTHLPIFPLPNVVLFPGVLLPLHIFEPRYRQMTTDAVAGDGLIGLTLIRPGNTPMQQRAPLFEVGCAGRITRLQELPDGRFNFVLEGVRRFRVLRELDTDRLYRVVAAEWLEEPDPEALSTEASEALERAAEHLRLKTLELARASVPDQVENLRQQIARLDPIDLAAQLAFGLNCGVVEKQGMLETDGALERIELLIRVMEFQRAEHAAGGGSQSVN
jgi:Lon protease-like protein